MYEDEALVAEELPLDGVAQRLRRAREEKGMDLPQVAAETRIPMRHLEVIERGAFDELPARTYAIGFSRTYAQTVGLDQNEIAQRLREELAMQGDGRPERREAFEPGDPAKIPSAGLAWFGAIGALLLFTGGMVYYNTFYGAGAGPAPLVADPEPALVEAQGEATPASGALASASATAREGQVVFTALEDGVWVRFYDVAGNRLLEKQMASGERFEIPSDAQGPQIWTGRPDAFAITVDGRAVPKLAEDDFVIRDVAISAEALLARGEAVTTSQLN